MSKLIAIALLTALMFGLSCRSNLSTRTTPPDEVMTVTVWFGGMMIFNKSKQHPLRKHRSEWKKDKEV